MDTDLQQFIEKLQNLMRRLKHTTGDSAIDALHLVEVYCELADLIISFNIEQYQEEEDSSTDDM
tara:strand:- start:87 stop:278 length:192 start_codon:yes stop_codon:yes gene_type:complete